MSDLKSFTELLARVRRRDDDATRRLFHLCEPELRRIVRVRLRSVRRDQECSDLLQSVFCNFYVRVTAGQFEIASMDDLIRLLATMAWNRLRDWVRHDQTQRRGRGDPGQRLGLEQIPTGEPTPVDLAVARELQATIMARLPEAERDIVEQRLQGQTWAELAHRRGELPDAVRKRFGRALDVVAGHLGLETVDDE